MRKYLVEFIGTFFLVFTVCAGSLTTDGKFVPLAAGAVLAAMVFAGGHISGAFLNPAVSVAAFVRGRLNAKDLGYYVLSQLLAGAAAAGVARFVAVGASPRAFSVPNGRPLIAAIVVELLFTFALAYTVLNVATSKDHPSNSFYGLAIGFTVLAGAVAVGAVSGGAFNPAVGLGVCLAGLAGWKMFWIFLLATLAGGVLAGYAFRQLNPDDLAPAAGSAGADKAAPAKTGVPTARRRT
jgi:aquaporin Z